MCQSRQLGTAVPRHCPCLNPRKGSRLGKGLGYAASGRWRAPARRERSQLGATPSADLGCGGQAEVGKDGGTVRLWVLTPLPSCTSRGLDSNRECTYHCRHRSRKLKFC